jgi:hypothetical protein
VLMNDLLSMISYWVQFMFIMSERRWVYNREIFSRRVNLSIEELAMLTVSRASVLLLMLSIICINRSRLSLFCGFSNNDCWTFILGTISLIIIPAFLKP